ncbi:hypothetical protein CEUSTIGMA_g10647.t1 [Chlamydomonas eustigma]|uniref:Uncharacterized protein n=1 Tax=Chlamydomonas eustigma TaxID=1157962 RepID=A0A250XJF6_9CHLO|nr:hypothetical protein CEUSTIGMA_g10647.t1 [Chlamydomonas eustigma]|eukprot:GAX83221.1 hypothetical protein CEUSTIGMA_g10647.t1 [Chlamydomonas eustigma]
MGRAFLLLLSLVFTFALCVYPGPFKGVAASLLNIQNDNVYDHQRRLLQQSTMLWTPPSQPLRVCVLEAHPVIVANVEGGIQNGTAMSSVTAQQKISGFGMNLLDAVFGQILRWNYTVTYYTSGSFELLYHVRSGNKCDLGVQLYFISPTNGDICNQACPSLPAGWYDAPHNDTDYQPYVCCLDFSYPFYNGGWAITSSSQPGSGDINYISVYFQSDIVSVMAVAVICTFFMAHAIWLIERTQYGTNLMITNPKEGFAPKYLDGIRDGVWFSSNALLNGTINAEKTIITPLGRVLVTLFVLFGILAMALVTSILSSTLTTNNLSNSQILTASDLNGLSVCMGAGLPSTTFNKNFPGVGISRQLVDNASECYSLLSNGAVDAVFDIRENAILYFQQGLGGGLLISPVVLPLGYGMAMQERYEYESPINEALLLWQQEIVDISPSYLSSTLQWFLGASSQITYGGTAPSSSTTKPFNFKLIGAAGALVAAYLLLQGFVIGAHWLSKWERKQVEEEEAVLEEAGMSTTASALRGKSVTQRLADFAGTLSEGPGAHQVEEGDSPELKKATSMRRMRSSVGSMRHRASLIQFSSSLNKIYPDPQDEEGFFSNFGSKEPNLPSLHEGEQEHISSLRRDVSDVKAAMEALQQQMSSFTQNLQQQQQQGGNSSLRVRASIIRSSGNSREPSQSGSINNGIFEADAKLLDLAPYQALALGSPIVSPFLPMSRSPSLRRMSMSSDRSSRLARVSSKRQVSFDAVGFANGEDDEDDENDENEGAAASSTRSSPRAGLMVSAMPLPSGVSRDDPPEKAFHPRAPTHSRPDLSKTKEASDISPAIGTNRILSESAVLPPLSPADSGYEAIQESYKPSVTSLSQPEVQFQRPPTA